MVLDEEQGEILQLVKLRTRGDLAALGSPAEDSRILPNRCTDSGRGVVLTAPIALSLLPPSQSHITPHLCPGRRYLAASQDLPGSPGSSVS